LQIAWLQSLKVQGLRNISFAEFSQFSRFNVFYGANGAGKTTLLEAIHLLGLGRSFRSAKHKPLINYEKDEFVVYGELSSVATSSAELPSVVPMGIRKHRDGSGEIKVRTQRAGSAAELAALLPLQVINAETFQLLLGSPALRRQFLDWGVFHVEHGFLEQWRRLQRCLKQRNSLLRRGKISSVELQPWDEELSRLTVIVTAYRNDYFKAWLPVLLAMVERLWPEGKDLMFTFHPGWDDNKFKFGELLQRQLPRDKEQGYTVYGPHRADMKIKLKGLPVGDVLSRGQLKLLSASMRLAQAAVLRLVQEKQCVFLVDDLPSELDVQRRHLFCELLSDLGSQVFVTSIDRHGWANAGFDQQELSVFHVEHGAVYP
jgi:DNA replication and repair protein RecF